MKHNLKVCVLKYPTWTGVSTPGPQKGCCPTWKKVFLGFPFDFCLVGQKPRLDSGLRDRVWTHALKASSSTVFAQTAGFSLALGMLVHGLSVCGHGKAEDVQPHLLASWMKVFLTEVSGPEPEDGGFCL